MLDQQHAAIAEVGFFVMDTESGDVGGVEPHEVGYGDAVLAQSARQVLFTRDYSEDQSHAVTFTGGALLGVYVLQDAETDSAPTELLRTLNFGDGLYEIGWEEDPPLWPETGGIGDRGYDDFVLSITVHDPVPVLDLEPINDQEVDEQTPFSLTPVVMNGDFPTGSLTYSLDVAPAEASINTSTGEISWTPDEVDGPGNFSFTVRVTDDSGVSDTESFSLTVNEVNRQPVLSPVDPQTLEFGETVSLTLTASDPDSPSNDLTFSLDSGAPDGLTVDPVAGQLTWNPPLRGLFEATVRVTDNGSPAMSDTRVIQLSTDCPFDDSLSGWQVNETGGSSTGHGTVVAMDCAAVLSEGDSFVTTLETTFTIPVDATSLTFEFASLQFDESDAAFINDAFEVALVDSDGNPLVPTFAQNRDAFLNFTEGLPEALGAGVTVVGGQVQVDVSGILPGEAATLIFRLTNNDADTASSVRIVDYDIPGFTGGQSTEPSAVLARSPVSLALLSEEPESVETDETIPVPVSAAFQTDGGPTIGMMSPFPGDYLAMARSMGAAAGLNSGTAMANVSRSIQVASPHTRLPADTSFVLWGEASVTGRLADGSPTLVTAVMLDGSPVDAIDASGRFFHEITVRPGTNRFTFTVHDLSGGSLSTSITIVGTQLEDGHLDLNRFTDVTDAMIGVYGRTSFDQQSDRIHVELASRNDAAFDVENPLLLGVTNLSEPAVQVLDPDGHTPEGIPYYDYSQRSNAGRLSPGDESTAPVVSFFNPTGEQFTYDLVFLAPLNEAPIFTMIPVTNGSSGRLYRYEASATDANDDTLTYSLLSGPSGATIDSTSGTMTWAPDSADVGTHDVTLSVSDGRGGERSQSWTLTVTPPPPNRPPVIISVPVTQADAIRRGPLQTQPFDLSDWSVIQLRDGDPSSFDQEPANWIVSDEGATATQTINADASLLLSNTDLRDEVIKGRLSVQTTNDDDFIGFVFGYQDEGHFYLFDWKKATQPFPGFGTAEAGMTVKRVSVDSPIGGPELWNTNGSSGRVLPLYHNAIPWSSFQEYSFELRHEGANITIIVSDESGILDTITVSDSAYPSGRFGFYNYSQDTVTYRGFERASLPVTDYEYAALAVDPDGDAAAWSFATPPPQGMRIDAATGLIRWSPTVDQVGNHEIALRASDGNGGIAEQTFVVCVHPDPANHDPVIISVPPATTSFNSTVTIPLTEDTLGDSDFFGFMTGQVGEPVPSTDFDNSQLSDPPFTDRDLRQHIFGDDSENNVAWTHFFPELSDAMNGPESVTATLEIAIGGIQDGNPMFPSLDDRLFIEGQEVLSAFDDLDQGAFGTSVFRVVLTSSQIASAFLDGELDVEIDGGTVSEHGTIESFFIDYSHVRFQQVVPTYSYDVQATDPDGDTLSYELVSGPPDVTLDSETGVLQWIPVEGESEFHVAVTDGRGGRDEQQFVLTVLPPGTGEIRGRKTDTAESIRELLIVNEAFNRADGVSLRDDYQTFGSTTLVSGGLESPGLMGSGGGISLDAPELSGLPLSFSFVTSSDSGTTHQPFIAFGSPETDHLADPRIAEEADDFSRALFAVGGTKQVFTDSSAFTVFVYIMGFGFTFDVPIDAGAGQPIRIEGKLNADLSSEYSFDVDDDGIDVVTVTRPPASAEPGFTPGRNFVLGHSTFEDDVITRFDDLTVTATVPATTQFLEPTPYLSFDDSPFNGRPFSQFYLEDFEDGLLNTPGVLVDRGRVFPRGSTPFIDSVDGDDGIIDGSGLSGASFGGVDSSYTFSFNADELGELPTHVGIVVTDITIGDTITLEAFGRNGLSIGRYEKSGLRIGDMGSGTTDEDRFFGMVNPDGISRFTISPNVFNWEVDHLQYGIFSDGEGLPGWTIYLDQNENGVRDPGETFTVTDENGDYEFTNLPDATYVVREEQQTGWTQTLPFELVDGPNLIVNGSFEEGGRGVFHAGSEIAPGWRVTHESVDVVGHDHFFASDGFFSVDLTGTPGSGRIEQTIPTVPGERYLLTFDLAGNPQGTAIKRLRVTAGNSSRDYEFDISPYSLPAIEYRREQLVFTAIADETVVAFESLNDGLFGPAIDVVSVHELIPTDSYTVVLNAGETADGIDFGNWRQETPTQAGPAFQSGPVDHIESEQLYRYNPVVNFRDEGSIAFGLVLAPAGMTVHPSMGTVVWRPDHEQLGEHQVILRVTDSDGLSATQSFVVTVTAANSAPAVTSVPSASAIAGHSFEYLLRAIDADDDTLTAQLVDAPAGSTIEPVTLLNSTGQEVDSAFRVTWNPDSGATGDVTFSISVGDGRGGAATQDFTVRVEPETATNAAPAITSEPRILTPIEFPYVYAVQVTDRDGDAISHTLLNGPSGLSLDGSGVVRWTPTIDDLGDHTVSVQVSDGLSTVTQTYTLTVATDVANSTPTITSVPTTLAVQDSEYRYAAQAEDADHDAVQWSLSAAPRGMAIDRRTGAVRWTPDETQLGTHAVEVVARDGFGASTRQRFLIEVTCNNTAPAIVSIPRTSAVESQVYAYAPRAEDLEGDVIEWSLATAITGMTIDPVSGILTWTPTPAQLGSHDVTLQASDGFSTGTQRFTIVVVAADTPVDPDNPDAGTVTNLRPVISSSPVFNAETNTLYRYDVAAIDPDGHPVSFSLIAAPPGMSIDAESGLVTWTPQASDVGDFVIEIAASDGRGGTGRQTYALSVIENLPPEITSQPVNEVIAGTTYRYTVRAVDPEGELLTFRLTDAPSGMAIDRFGRIRWLTDSSASGSESVTVQVTDNRGQIDTQSFEVTILPDTSPPNINLSATIDGRRVTSGITVDVNTDFVATVIATDNVGVESVALFRDGVPVSLQFGQSATIAANSVGTITLRAVATDAAGNSSERTIEVLVRDPAGPNQPVSPDNPIPTDDTLPPHPGTFNDGDGNAPVVAITSPAVGETVSGRTPLIGTVDDPEDNLWYYRTYFARLDRVELSNIDLSDSDWTVFHEGTSEVVNGEIAVFDPSLLANDVYAVAVAAFDFNGNGFVQPTFVAVEGGLLLGNFNLAFTDLSIPLAGIPIEVTRVYDTLDAQDEGDFGYGWSLGVQDARILETTPEEFAYIPGQTKIYLTNPEGRRVGFTYDEELVRAGFFGDAEYRIVFRPDPGVYDTLTVDRTAIVRGGIGGAFATVAEALSGVFNPDEFTLTTKDGLKYRYSETDGLQSITDLNGNVATFSNDGISHSSGSSIQFIRDHRGRIREIIDPSGNSLTYRYNLAGDLVSFSDQNGLTTTYSYLASPAHYLDEARDPRGRRALKAVYEDDMFVGVIDAAGNRIDDREYEFEANTAIIRDGNGNETTLIYDDRGNILREIDALGRETIREYNDPANPDLETRVVDRDGNVTDREYDARGNVLRIIERGSLDDPLANAVVTQFTYDSGNRVTSIQNALGAITTFRYNSDGNLTRITNAEGSSSSFTYDEQGRRASFTDFNGNTTTFEYDEGCPCGSPERVIFADGTYQEFEYNQYGQVLSEKYFEADGTLVEQSSTEYDLVGRVLVERDGEGNEVRRFYDGHLLDYQVIVNPESLDGSGVLLESPATPVADRKSRITDFEYDENDRVIRQIDAEGGVVEFRYDAQGNRVLLQDPVGNITTWVYDSQNRVIEERDPFYNEGLSTDEALAALQLPSGADADTNTGAAHVTVTAYDGEGNRTKVIDRNQRRREFEYDHAGRLLVETWFDPDNTLVGTITFAYDALGNMLTANDPDSNYVFTYDTLNRLTSVDNAGTPGAPNVILTYAYDAQGNVTTTQDNFGVTVASEYDTRNRLAIRRWFDVDGSGDVDDVRVDFQHNAAGRESGIQRYSDLGATILVGTTTRTYDLAGRSDLLRHDNPLGELLAGYDYDYDFSGLLVHEERTHQDTQFAQSIDYVYDLTGQLTDAFFSGQDDEHYEYDANGNRLSSRVGDDERTYTTGIANQLESDGRYSYEYDGEGNLVKRIDLTTGETRTFEYGQRNQLDRIDDWSSDPGDPTVPVAEAVLEQSVNYIYDALARRIARVVDSDGIATQSSKKGFFVPNGDNTWGDFDQAGKALSRYLFGNRIDQNTAKFEAAVSTVWYLADQQGTVHELIDDSGVMLNHVSYSAFGVVTSHSHDQFSDRFLYTARELDQATGDYFYRARAYTAEIGRFLGHDPLLFDFGEYNPFQFVDNSPLNGTDPRGTANLARYAVLVVVPTVAGAAIGGAVGLACAEHLDTPGERFEVVSINAIEGAFIGLSIGVILALDRSGRAATAVASIKDSLIARLTAAGIAGAVAKEVVDCALTDFIEEINPHN